MCLKHRRETGRLSRDCARNIVVPIINSTEIRHGDAQAIITRSFRDDLLVMGGEYHSSSKYQNGRLFGRLLPVFDPLRLYMSGGASS